MHCDPTLEAGLLLILRWWFLHFLFPLSNWNPISEYEARAGTLLTVVDFLAINYLITESFHWILPGFVFPITGCSPLERAIVPSQNFLMPLLVYYRLWSVILCLEYCVLSSALYFLQTWVSGTDFPPLCPISCVVFHSSMVRSNPSPTPIPYLALFLAT